MSCPPNCVFLPAVAPSQLCLEWFCSTLSCIVELSPRKLCVCVWGGGDIYESLLRVGGVPLDKQEKHMDKKICYQDMETRGQKLCLRIPV